MTIRLAVIGCGYITQASHGPAFARLAAENADLVLAACCDTDLGRAETAREAFGFLRAYSDLDEMLNCEKPSAVCLNVPVGRTAPLSAHILAAGIPLLTEKPPALTVDELDPLIRLASQSAVLHQVAFNRRFTPLVQQLRRLLLGQTVLNVQHTFTRVGRLDPDFTTTAIHGIDTLRFLLSMDFASLQFQFHDCEFNGSPITIFTASGKFSSGASVQMLFQPVAGRAVERTVIHTPGSTYELRLGHGQDAPGRLLHWQGGRLIQDQNAADLCGSGEDFVLNGFYGEDAAFLEAVRAGKGPPEHGFQAARQSVEIMQALRERRADFRQSAAAPL